MALRNIRIGIVGAGSIVREKHLPQLHKLQGVEVVGVANRTRASAEKVGRDFRIPSIANDWKDLITKAEVDVIWIGTNPHMHKAVTLAALEAGKHVFCQARMARNYDEAEAMYHKAIERPHQVTMLCPSPVAMKGDLYVRKLLKEGFIGRLYSVRVQSLGSQFADANVSIHWRQQMEINGFNALTLGIYHEIIQRWVGCARSVQALAKVFINTRTVNGSAKLYEVRIPDDLMVLVDFATGAQGTYHFSGVSRYAPTDKIELYGSDGTLVYDVVADKLFGARAPQEKLEEMPIPPDLSRDWKVEEDFINAVRAAQANQPWQVSPDFYEGLKYMEFVEGVLRSAHTRRAVDLPFQPCSSSLGHNGGDKHWS